jgi:hemerythrin-like domain-containing protein
MLLGEHAVVLSALDYVERNAAHWSLEQLLEASKMLKAILQQHASFEDSLLFDHLPQQSASVEDVLRAMRRDHDSIRDAYLKLQEAETATLARSQIVALFEKTREHFALEERMMFPLAERVMGAEKIEELGRELARRRALASATL